MRIFAAIILFTAICPGLMLAQRSQGYWFIAPGGATANGNTRFTIHMGGGGEVGIWKGIAAGVEVGALGPREHFTDNVLGVASLNGYYHFRPSKTARFDPFATAGYSLFFRSGTANLANVGAGVNYWFQDHLAFRLEFRDHIDRGPLTTHYWGVRMGLSFTNLWP
jgi:hypothetical protein